MGIGKFLNREKGVIDGIKEIYNSRNLKETFFFPGVKKDT